VSTTKAWEKTTLKGMNKYGEGLPLRPWVAKGHEYEIHTRCNGYRSITLDDLRDAHSVVNRAGQEVGDHPEGVHRYQRGLVLIHYNPVREQTLQIGGTLDGQAKTQPKWEYIVNIRDCVLDRAMTANRLVAWKFYNHWGLGATCGFIRASTTFPTLTKGIAWLVHVRCRALPRVFDCWNHIIRSGRQPTYQKNKCPLCLEKGTPWMGMGTSVDGMSKLTGPNCQVCTLGGIDRQSARATDD